MLGGGTLVTISLAGSLFFSISPDAADHKVLLYLLFTLAPFAIVSPLLGLLIDKSRGASPGHVCRVGRGAGRPVPIDGDAHPWVAVVPLAFLVLVFQKLYLVTKGALVPEMAAMTAPDEDTGEQAGYAPLNARLTLLGTLAGFVVSVPAVILYKLGSSPAVLIFATIVFVGAAGSGPAPGDIGTAGRAIVDGSGVPGARVRVGGRGAGPRAGPHGVAADREPGGDAGVDGHVHRAGAHRVHDVHAGVRPAPHEGGGPRVVRLRAGRDGVGAIIGLVLVGRLRKRFSEQQLLLGALWLIAATAAGCAVWGTLFAQVVLAFMVGLCGSVAQPSFDAMTQRYIPLSAQGRAFARFGMRQQLVWVVGSLIPVIVAFSLPQGDATDGRAGCPRRGVVCVPGRRAAHAPRVARDP